MAVPAVGVAPLAAVEPAPFARKSTRLQATRCFTEAADRENEPYRVRKRVLVGPFHLNSGVAIRNRVCAGGTGEGLFLALRLAGRFDELVQLFVLERLQ